MRARLDGCWVPTPDELTASTADEPRVFGHQEQEQEPIRVLVNSTLVLLWRVMGFRVETIQGGTAVQHVLLLLLESWCEGGLFGRSSERVSSTVTRTSVSVTPASSFACHLDGGVKAVSSGDLSA